MQVNCPYCQTSIDIQNAGQYTCQQCRAIFRVDLPEPAAPPPAPPPQAPRAPSAGDATLPGMAPSGSAPGPVSGAPAPPPAPGPLWSPREPARAPSVPEGARCAKHSDRDAIQVCTRCGNFTCGLCAVSLPQGSHCPECAERVRAEAQSTPWDERKKIGFYPAAKETVRQVIFEPTRFFSKMPRTGGYESPLLFAIVLGMLGAVVGLIFSWGGVLFGLQFGNVFQRFQGVSTPDMAAFVGQLAVQSVVQVICMPVGIVIGAFIYAGIFHLGLMIFGAAKNGFEATVRAWCFSQATQVFSLVLLPVGAVGAVLGGLTGGIAGATIGGAGVLGLYTLVVFFWQLGIQVIALREAHETTTGKALGAILLPILFFICCIGGGVGLIAAAAMRAGSP